MSKDNKNTNSINSKNDKNKSSNNNKKNEITEKDIEDLLKSNMKSFEELIKGIDDRKKAKIILDWFSQFYNYIESEDNFHENVMPGYRAYKRGEILFTNFGFNIGAEIGGMRFVIVIEKDNTISNRNIIVAPLTTFGEDEKIDPTPEGCIYIGKIQGLKSNHNYVKVNQLRPISKMRIYRPKYPNQIVFKIRDKDILDKIDTMVKSLITKN